MAGLLERSAQAIRDGLRERVLEPRALKAAQRRSPEIADPPSAEPDHTGRAEVGEALLAGRFSFAGHTVSAAPRALWRAPPPSRAWAEAAQSFEWLADLDAVGGPRARSAAIALMIAWIDRHRAYQTLAWRTDLAARRLWSWLGADLSDPDAGLTADGGEATRARLRRSLSAHVLWLERREVELAPGTERIRAAASLARAALSLPGLEDRAETALSRLEAALSEGLTADGAPVSRNPEDAYRILMWLQTLRERFAARAPGLRDLAAPEGLSAAAPRLASALRFFRMADGGLPLFHGARAVADGRVDALLTRARLVEAAPNGLAEGGFLRMAGGRVSAIMDVGPTALSPEDAHVSPLAIEVTSGRRRMIVSCGSAAHLDPAWDAACRSVAGHSTLSLAPHGAPERPEPAAREVAAERRVERNGVWLFGAHDGYLESHGLQVSRRMFLTADGGDFRGEDVVELHPDGGRTFEKRLARLRRADRTKGQPFDVRFHLHPDVEAELVADGEAVTLRLPHGESWVMRQAGGRIQLVPSAYLDQAAGPRPTQAILVKAAFAGERAQVRWAFRRVGELAQQPKDVDALLAASEPAKAPPLAEAGDERGRSGAKASPGRGPGRLGPPPFSG